MRKFVTALSFLVALMILLGFKLPVNLEPTLWFRLNGSFLLVLTIGILAALCLSYILESNYIDDFFCEAWGPPALLLAFECLGSWACYGTLYAPDLLAFIAQFAGFPLVHLGSAAIREWYTWD